MMEVQPGQRRRGSSRKSAKGWAHLPIDVLQHIFRYSIIDVLPATATSENWLQLKLPGGGVNYRLYEVCQRAGLARLRLVSRAWTEAVDSHDFWHKYMNHLGGAILPPAPVQHSSRTAAKSPTAFAVAAYTTSCRCLICYVNNTLFARPTVTCRTRYGIMSTCANHQHNHCRTCLVAGDIETLRHPFLADSSGDLAHQNYGYALNYFTCKACREHRYRAHVRAEFCGTGDARGIVTVEGDSLSNYLYRGVSTARAVARHAVALEWIKPRVPYEHIARAASCLDQHEIALSHVFYDDRSCEDDQQRSVRKGLEAVLWDRPRDLEDDGEDEEDRALEKLYQSWEDILEERELSAPEDNDDQGPEIEYDELMSEVKGQTRFMARLLQACVRHYVNARMRGGWWVHPRDELAYVFHKLQVNAPSTPKPFTPISSALAVDPLVTHGDQAEALQVFSVTPDYSLAAEPFETVFLPSNHLIELMAHEYQRWFYDNLDPPLMQIVDFIEGMDEDDDGKMELARSMTASRILGLLRTQDPWVQNGLLTGVSGKVISSFRYERDGSPLPEHINALELLRQVPSTSSLKRSPVEDERDDADQAKRRKASHDSNSSLGTLSLVPSGPSTAPTALTTPDLEEVAAIGEEEQEIMVLVGDVPFVPAPGVQIGITAEHYFTKSWESASQRLFECRCSICTRREVMGNGGENFEGTSMFEYETIFE